MLRNAVTPATTAAIAAQPEHARRHARVQQLRHFQHGRAEDDRRRDQEREMRRPLVVDAAQQAADDRRAGARDAGDQRRALPEADGERVARRSASTAAGAPRRRAAARRTAAAAPLTTRKAAATTRRAEQAAEELLQHEAHDHRRDGRDHDQAEHAPALAHLMRRADSPSTPISSAHQSRQKYSSSAVAVPRCSITRNGRNAGRALVDVPAQQRRQHHRVAKAAHRKQFGRTLDDRDHDRLQTGHGMVCPPAAAVVVAAAQSFIG